MDKVFGSPEEAIADLPDGATVTVAGFGLGHRFPTSLLEALRDTGVKDLCLVCNSLGGSNDVRQQLVERRQVRKLMVAFSARPGLRSAAEEQIASGDIELEMVPQGMLVERCRAGGAGIPAFYSPVGVGTDVAADKEVREFNGRQYTLEHAITVDFALLRAWRGDRLGNLQFRGGSQNFNPAFAKAARVAIAEVDELVDVGEIPPEAIDLPGVFVARVVKATRTVDIAELFAGRPARRTQESARHYLGKPGLTRSEMARCVAGLFADGSVVNLGMGLPTLVSNHLAGRDVTLHAENGILGYGGIVQGEAIDPDIYNAGGEFVSLEPGAAFFDSVTSFEIARGGLLDAVVLGAYQVDQEGNLANWSTPEMVGGGIGGAMDLVAGAKSLVILMEHRDSKDRAKLVSRCEYPLTGPRCVDVVVTDLALLRRSDGLFTLEAIAPGFTVDEVLGLTDMEVRVSEPIGAMNNG
ncbi:MAG TPA: 3-oxoacid CoA-transferase [Chloroflexota bacterium]|nr:3-oxoacid CoA-transferase [Chloroflexota bacterium]